MDWNSSPYPRLESIRNRVLYSKIRSEQDRVLASARYTDVGYFYARRPKIYFTAFRDEQ